MRSSSALRRVVLLVVCVASVGGGGRAEDALSRPRPRRELPPETWGDLARGLVVRLSGRPWFNTEAEINRVVGNPLTLQAPTRANLRLLPSRLRLVISTELAKALGVVDQDKLVQVVGVAADGTELRQVVISNDEAEEVAREARETAEDQLDDEEQIDLAVMLLSRWTEYPRNPVQWRHLRSGLVRSDIWIGLGVVAIQALDDQANVSLSGRAFSIRDPVGRERLRLGWTADFSDLGVSGEPLIEAGARAVSPWLDSTFTYVYDARELENIPREELRLRFEDNWLSLVAPSGLEVSVSAEMRYSLDPLVDDDRVRESGSLNLFSRANDLFGPGRNLLAGGRLISDRRSEQGVELSGGFENQYTGSTAVLQVAVSTAGQDSEDSPNRIGVLAGFPVGPYPNDWDHLPALLSRHRYRMETGLTQVQVWRDRVAAIDATYARSKREVLDETWQALRSGNVDVAGQRLLELARLQHRHLQARLVPESWLLYSARLLCHEMAVYSEADVDLPLAPEKKHPGLPTDLLKRVEASCRVWQDPTRASLGP